jgi:hypothetical protein
MPIQLPALFDYEWTKVQGENQIQLDILTIIAHHYRKHCVADFARILHTSEETIRASVAPLDFVHVDPQTAELSFISHIFATFAAEKLIREKPRANDLVIEDLLENKDSDLALSQLPTYLQEVGRLEDLLDFLSPERLDRMVEHFQSLTPLKQKADMGVNTALKLNREGDLARFSMQKSAISELDGANIWTSELEARMALNDYDSAMALAHSTPLKEEKLHLLAIIAKGKHQQGLSPEPEVIEEIGQLYTDIDPNSLGEIAVDIVADLLYSRPDLAVDLIEKWSGTDVEEDALDRAFAKLSFEAVQASRDISRGIDTAESMRSRIKDPTLRRFSVAVAILLCEYSAEKVIAKVEKIDSAHDRLYLLRQWSDFNRNRTDTYSVVDYALTLAIKTSTYSPTARVLRQLASPVPSIAELRNSKQLVGRFDSLKDAAERLGPTKDYVRLQLLLATAESKYYFESAENRPIELYFYVDQISDIVTKAECLAHLCGSLEDVDPEHHLETNHSLHSAVTNDLNSSIASLLTTTAEHYHVCRGIIRALARTKCDAALCVVKSINTEDRRDRALAEIVRAIVETPPAQSQFPILPGVLDSFADSYWRDKSLATVIDQIYNVTDLDSSLCQGSR